MVYEALCWHWPLVAHHHDSEPGPIDCGYQAQLHGGRGGRKRREGEKERGRGREKEKKRGSREGEGGPGRGGERERWVENLPYKFQAQFFLAKSVYRGTIA